MTTRTPVTTKDLLPDDPVALGLARAAGAHGVYVQNALAKGEGCGFLFERDGSDVGLCWFGPRGNLVILGDDDLSLPVASSVVDAIGQAQQAWRIAMGPTAVVNVLRERTPGKPLLLRDQVYYVGSCTTVSSALVRTDVRLAQRADRDRLVQATLQLNASDLNIEPARVDRRWLRDTIDERIAEGTTKVLGAVGRLDCKLDFGSDGPGGRMLEGVFTFPECRGRGLAAALVATCLQEAHGVVSLHVGMHNAPARAAYERAGMAAVGRCRLLLLG